MQFTADTTATKADFTFPFEAGKSNFQDTWRSKLASKYELLQKKVRMLGSSQRKVRQAWTA